jgi:hypothetical protein
MGFSYIQHNNTIVILACNIYTKCPPPPPPPHQNYIQSIFEIFY